MYCLIVLVRIDAGKVVPRTVSSTVRPSSFVGRPLADGVAEYQRTSIELLTVI